MVPIQALKSNAIIGQIVLLHYYWFLKKIRKFPLKERIYFAINLALVTHFSPCIHVVKLLYLQKTRKVNVQSPT